MNTRRKSTLFLIEQLAVIVIFALCAGICVNILTSSYIMATNSKDTANALIAAQNCAEAFKAAGGDVNAAIHMLGGKASSDISLLGSTESSISSDNDIDFCITAFYDKDWRQVEIDNNSNAVFLLTVYGSEEHYGNDNRICAGIVTVSKIGGENLITLPVAARGTGVN